MSLTSNNIGNNLVEDTAITDTTRETDSTSRSDTEAQKASSNNHNEDQSEEIPPARV